MIAAKLLILLGLTIASPAAAPWGGFCSAQPSHRRMDSHHSSLLSGSRQPQLLTACTGLASPWRFSRKAAQRGVGHADLSRWVK